MRRYQKFMGAKETWLNLLLYLVFTVMIRNDKILLWYLAIRCDEIVLHQAHGIGIAALVCTAMLERFIVEEHRKGPSIMLFISVQQWGSIVTAPKITRLQK